VPITDHKSKKIKFYLFANKPDAAMNLFYQLNESKFERMSKAFKTTGSV